MPVVHSFVHAGKDKVTSLTMTFSRGKFLITMSDKKDMIRVMLDPDEIAGLSDAVKSRGRWDSYHKFEKEGTVKETKIQYNGSFFNLESAGKKIAIKLTDNELSAFHRVLDLVFNKIVGSKMD